MAKSQMVWPRVLRALGKLPTTKNKLLDILKITIMMKKKYIVPTAMVVTLAPEYQLCAGSGKGGYDIGGDTGGIGEGGPGISGAKGLEADVEWEE